jgi:hypothetical protein
MNRHGRRVRQLDSRSGKQLQPPVFSCGNCAKSWSGGNPRPPEIAHDCSGLSPLDSSRFPRRCRHPAPDPSSAVSVGPLG